MNNSKCDRNDKYCKCDCNTCDKYQPDWLPLEKENIPNDFLIKEYEIDRWEINMWEKSVYNKLQHRDIIISCLMKHDAIYRYRPIQEVAPTHKEIMSRCWLIDDDYHKIISYRKRYKGDEYHTVAGLQTADYFIDRKYDNE